MVYSVRLPGPSKTVSTVELDNFSAALYQPRNVHFIFSRGNATLHLAMLVGPSIGHIFEFQAVLALLLLPNCLQLDCRVSGLI